MSSKARSRRRRILTRNPLVVVVALFGLLGGPCAMPVVGAIPADVVAGVHDNCPNAGGDREMRDDDCCCLVSVAGITADLQPKSSPIWVALPPTPLQPVMPPGIPTAAAAPLRACLHETSPPVYLATRRLRI